MEFGNVREKKLEFALGILVGLLLAVILLVAAVWFLQSRSVRAPLPDMPTFEGEPSVMVMMIEPFLNHQLRAALEAEAEPDDFVDAPTAAPSAGPAPKPSRFKLKLDNATLDIQTGQHAKFYALLTAHAWNVRIQVRPVTDMQFGLMDGRVRIHVTNVQVAGFNVPRALIDRFVSSVVANAEAKLNHSLIQLERDTDVRLFTIETTEDLMILKFAESAKPASSKG